MKTNTIVLTEWTEADIKGGLYIIKNTSPLGSSDLNFAATVTYKIGFTSDGGYGLISCLTDGMYFPVGDKVKMIERLNKGGENGYRPLTKVEYQSILEHTDQGFIAY